MPADLEPSAVTDFTLQIHENQYVKFHFQKDEEVNINNSYVAVAEITPVANNNYFESFKLWIRPYVSPPVGTVPPLLMTIIYSCIAFSCGMLLVLQTGQNDRAGDILGHPIRGSFISFFGSTIVLIPLSFDTFPAASKTLVTSFRQSKINHGHYFFQWYDLIGGILGAISVGLSVFLTEIVGFSVFFVARISGQVIVSIVLDHFALIGYVRRPFNILKLIGVLFTLAGCIMIQDFTSNANPVGTVIYSVILGFVSGFIQPVQTGLNTQLTKHRMNGSARGTAALYFAIGACACLIASAVTIADVPLEYNSSQNVWWAWLGGPLGIVYIFFGITLPPVAGLSAFYVSVVAGQLTMSLLTDALGIFGAVVSYATTPVAICGIIVSFIGALIITIAKEIQTKQALKDTATTINNTINTQSATAPKAIDTVAVVELVEVNTADTTTESLRPATDIHRIATETVDTPT